MKRIKFMIPYLLISILIIIVMAKVYADYLYNSNNVYYNNSGSSLNASDVQGAIDELYEKANACSSSGDCPEGYEKEMEENNFDFICIMQNKPICKRASTLHTETCNSDTSYTSYYCRADGYSTITYGQLGTPGTLASGDAFDCDVNGDGVYDAQAERFYYVSDYYDTSSKTFDNTYATLIYYSNTTSGTASTNSVAWCSGSEYTYSGPTTAREQLPTASQWSNVSLKSTTRNILMGYDVTSVTSLQVSNFSYEGYAARLLTMQELYSGCYDGSHSITSAGGLSYKCKFLMERTRYSTSSYATSGLWLESTYNSYFAWFVESDKRRAGDDYMAYYKPSSSIFGARPVIEIPKSQISY